MDLTEGDKIRNFVLMGQKPENQETFYKKYWSRIEALTGNDIQNNNGVSLFIRDYLSVMRHSTPAMNQIYPVFKAYVQEKDIAVEDLLRELLEYARLYEMLICSKFEDEVVSASIRRLNYLETTVSRPFFMQVLNLHKQGILTSGELREIFLMVENYLFRRNICEVPTNALNKVFLNLNREIHRYDGSYENYVEKMKYALTSKKETTRFPDDQEFSSALSEKQIYLMRSHYKNYLFERFENYGTDEVKDVLERIESGKYTIEHIMPQTMTPSWRAALGGNSEDIHSRWIHRLANLTLTAYNSSYSNNSFQDKRDAENGLKNSGIRMNQRIAQKDKWTQDELEERDAYMVSRALEIWRYPVSEYRPAQKQMDSVTLDDDINMTGSLIAKFAYKDTEQAVDSWTDMFTRVLKILHAEDSSVLTGLAYVSDPAVELATHVASHPEELSGKVQIAPNIYVSTGGGTQFKLNMLRKIFSLFGDDPSDLIFYLRNQDEGSTEESPERYEIRKKYWAFALPYIQEKFGTGGVFSRVSRSISNWISGGIGISGFSITCVANFDLARVVLSLSKQDKDENKTAFDFLYKHKPEIEERLGIQLEWERADVNKSSSVIYTLPAVSIGNETDWIRMAKFHAEWSRKFYDVFVPLLNELYPG